MIVGIVLARGGSRRVPRKNIKPLAGVPLIGWTLDAARLAASLEMIVVSSDDDEILAVAEEYGATAVKRPAALAADDTPCYDAMFHALDMFPSSHVALLQPTSPLRVAADIDGCAALVRRGAVSAVSVCEGSIEPNGAVYIARTDWVRATRLFDDPTLTRRFVMPSERSVDIDTEADFVRAERLMLARAA